MRLQPVLKKYIWGTEYWEVSTHPDGLSLIENGTDGGGSDKPKTLLEATGELPVIVKTIVTNEPLSLQVHPAEKNEMWYILSAVPHAEIILGFNRSYTKDEIRGLFAVSGMQAQAQKPESATVLSAVNRIPVRPGDCYCIPSGLVHSIGKGITLIEVQQSSNITYRLYDYGRVDNNGNPRPLHIGKALEVIDTSLTAQKPAGNVLAGWEYFKCILTEKNSRTKEMRITAPDMKQEIVIDIDTTDRTTFHIQRQ